MITPDHLPIDVNAMLNAPPAERIATKLMWDESLKITNSQLLRDECSRAVGRFLMHFLSHPIH